MRSERAGMARGSRRVAGYSGFDFFALCIRPSDTASGIKQLHLESRFSTPILG